MRRGFFILPAAAIVGALALAGCTADEPAAKQAAPSSPPATASATPTPTPPPPPATPYPHPTPEEPDAMYQHTDAGAIATAAYFVELLGYTGSTGDTSRFSAISAPECGYCKHQLEYVKHIYSLGSWADNYTTTDITPVGYGPPPEGEIGDLAVRLDVSSPAYNWYIPDEGGLKRSEASTSQMAIALEWREDRWIVLEASGRNEPK